MPVKVYDGTNWVTVAGDGAQGPAGTNATSSSIVTWVKTASGGETSVSGTGDTGYGTLAYTVGQELVYLNGVLLDRGDDYTATSGTSITGLTALTANDVVTVWTVNSFSVANTYTIAQADAAFAPVAAGGLTFITKATPSGATAVNINNCFTSSYQNYVITYNLVGSTGTNLSMRLRNGGTDRTTSNYDYFGQSIQVSGTSGGWYNSGGTKWDLNDLSATRTTGTLHLFNPQETSITSGHSHTVSTQATDRFVTIGLNFNSSTSNDGFSIFPDSGTFTGTVRVYGIANG